MSQRWRILALLFAVRATMAFQFQSVAALAPLIQREFGVGLADLGLAIGLYLAPGVALALPGGAIGKWFADKTAVMIGLALMIGGGLVTALSASWDMQLIGRLVAGTGGVLLNVVMSKMITDWFAGKEIATAMAVFVNSWPFGIALALVVLPFAGTRLGVSGAFLLTTALIAVGLFMLAVFYRSPAASGAARTGNAWPRGTVLLAVICAGVIWGLFNSAIGMVFGFGTTMLAERGWELAAASSTTSVVLWLTVISVPLGGILADRSGRPTAVLIAGCLGFGACLLFATRTDAVVPAFVLLGLLGGLPAGPIMSLPTRVLAAETRAVGMGIFFTLFYLSVVIAPWAAGSLASAAGTARVTFDVGAALLVACCACTWAFQRLAMRIERGSGAAQRSSPSPASP